MPHANTESIQLQAMASLTVSSMSHDEFGLQTDEDERVKKEDSPIEVFEDQQYGSNEIWSPGLCTVDADSPFPTNK